MNAETNIQVKRRMVNGLLKHNDVHRAEGIGHVIFEKGSFKKFNRNEPPQSARLPRQNDQNSIIVDLLKNRDKKNKNNFVGKFVTFWTGLSKPEKTAFLMEQSRDVLSSIYRNPLANLSARFLAINEIGKSIQDEKKKIAKTDKTMRLVALHQGNKGKELLNVFRRQGIIGRKDTQKVNDLRALLRTAGLHKYASNGTLHFTHPKWKIDSEHKNIMKKNNA